MTSALAKVEISDSAHLKSLLTETENPLQSIKQFQNNNAIALESLASALPLLDLHGISRFDFHGSVFEQLKLMLERRIEDISNLPKEESYQKLIVLLNKSFPLASAPLLRPLIMRVLTKIDNIPQEHLQALVEDSALYKSAPLEVRRHIWLSNPHLFCQEVREEIKQYVENINKQMIDFRKCEIDVILNPRLRRKNCTFLMRIVEMTRANSTLYKKAIESIKEEFKVAPLHSQPFIASLRSGILMALHESEHQEMVSNDPVYKFTWCIDACIRAKEMNILHQRELYDLLNADYACKNLFDTSLILFDPSANSLLLQEIKKELMIIFKSMRLPRSSKKLKFLLRLLKIGSMAPELCKEDVTEEPNIDDSLLSMLLTSILISLANTEDIKLSNDICCLQNTTFKTTEMDLCQFPPIWKQIILSHGRFSGQLLKLQISLFPEVSYPLILPLFGRNCRDMLSDQIFLHEIGKYVLKNENRSEEFLAPFLLKFLLSGKQAREIASTFAVTLLADLGTSIPDELKTKVYEKLQASKKKEKKKVRKKVGKTGKKKQDKKLKIKLTLKNAESSESE